MGYPLPPAEAATVSGRPREFARVLGLWDATAIVAGSMIGSGIFLVSADIARQVQAPAWLLAVWAMTAVLTVIGALTYGELAAMMPRAGGQYVFLREAYGPLPGFLYGWTLFTVIQTGTIAAVAVAFARFSAVLVPALESPPSAPFVVDRQRALAIAVIAFLTWVNTMGVHSGRWVQNVFTAGKVGSLFLLVLVGVFFAPMRGAGQENWVWFWGKGEHSWSVLLPAFGAAMVGALFSADAWNNVTFAAGEVRNPRRTIPMSLLLGAAGVTGLYFVTNVVYLAILPLWGDPQGGTVVERGIQYAAHDRVATAAMEALFGAPGTVIMAVAIMVSTFGCANGLILAGARVYHAMAQDGLFFRAAGYLNTHRVPGFALVLQGVWASLLVLSGSYSDLLDYVIFAALLFYALTAAAVFVLRHREPERERPYRVVGYPWLPALYILLTLAICVDLLFVKPRYTWPGLALVLAGVPVYWAARRGFAHGRSNDHSH